MPLIVVATERSDVLAAVERALTRADFTIVDAGAGLELLRLVFELRPQAVILDQQLSGIEWLELLRVLRAASDVPIIAMIEGDDAGLTAQALDMGADDVVHPATPPVELVARLRATLRRTTPSPQVESERVVVRTGALEVDRVAKEVRKHGDLILLTPTEYRLLDVLASRVGRIAPHRFLMSTVWGDEDSEDTHYLRVYIGYLRNKLEDDPGRPRYLVNEWGMGYRLAQLPVEPSEGEPPTARDAEGVEPTDGEPGAPGRGRAERRRRWARRRDPDT